MKPKCIALDFDHTLVYYKDGYEGLFNIFTKRGISDEIVQEAYAHAKKSGGFSVANLISVLAANGRYVMKDKSAAREFEEWLASSLTLYEDAKIIIRYAERNSRAPLAIVTCGNTEYQAQKIQMAKIPHDHLCAVDRLGAKHEPLDDLLDRYGAPILYVDDRASELDRIRRALDADKVHTVHLSRPRARYAHEKPEFSHDTIKSLEEIAPWLD